MTEEPLCQYAFSRMINSRNASSRRLDFSREVVVDLEERWSNPGSRGFPEEATGGNIFPLGARAQVQRKSKGPVRGCKVRELASRIGKRVNHLAGCVCSTKKNADYLNDCLSSVKSIAEVFEQSIIYSRVNFVLFYAIHSTCYVYASYSFVLFIRSWVTNESRLLLD